MATTTTTTTTITTTTCIAIITIATANKIQAIANTEQTIANSIKHLYKEVDNIAVVEANSSNY